MTKAADLSKYIGVVDYAVYDAYVAGGKCDKGLLKQFSENMMDSLVLTGAALIKNAPILKCRERILGVTREFFALDEDVKAQMIFFREDGFEERYKNGEEIKSIKTAGGLYDNRGHVPYGVKKAEDYKEFYHADQAVYQALKGVSFDRIPNIINSKKLQAQLGIKDFVHDFDGAVIEMTDTGREMGGAFLDVLSYTFKLPENDCTQMGDSVMRLLHYPKFDREKLKDVPKATRAEAHKDIACGTFLLTSKEAGLQLLPLDAMMQRFGTTFVSKEDFASVPAEEWIDIPPMEDMCVFNAGIWPEYKTNGIIPATIHQVITVPGREEEERWSTPFFFHAEAGSLLEPWDEAVQMRGGINHFPERGEHKLTLREFVHEDAKREWIKPQKPVPIYVP
jgi:isopenicillin N synthase-like dioxygenase